MNINLMKNIIEDHSITSDGEIVNLHNAEIENMIVDLVALENSDRHFRKEQMNLRKSREGLKVLINEHCGSFYFYFYNKSSIYSINNQYLFRFIFLCTYMDYTNKINYGKSKNSYIKESNLQEILGLSKREFQYTKNELLNNKLIKLDCNGYVYINRTICRKGRIRESINNENQLSIRIFTKFIQSLYLSSSPREHKKLGLLLKLLPFVHYNRNILCSNPYENNIDAIDPLSITDLTKLLGYSSNSKLRNGLMDLKINGESAVMICSINHKNMVVINPKLYYKGNSLNKLNYLLELFKI